MAHEFVEALGIRPVNSGACTGKWLETGGAELLSINPSNDEPIAKVRQATGECYERVVQAAQAANPAWAMTPAPERGEIVRQLGDELRKNKERARDDSSRSRWARFSRRGWVRFRR